ncbi:hypothetical protein HXX76_005098 [Chlamydomonas incerta]|uniref:Uncharacterized protein n=1 Tax=Chlamydomonas incerta TaxID=51695 RepID=A0A835T418_CHLIN|nr:hypothetical protein HXX76_005098 [Chlamydomonas incerta]|eukprot:KAG2438547.1 hypothetical protein HXX76_005098 [Chlamydomonas incerta]
MRQLASPRRVPALFALGALLLLAGPASSQQAAQDTTSNRAPTPGSVATSSGVAVAALQANTHLLLHGEVLLGAALFLPRASTPHRPPLVRNSSTEDGASQQADPAAHGAAVTGSGAAPPSPTSFPGAQPAGDAAAAAAASSLLLSHADDADDTAAGSCDGDAWGQVQAALAAAAAAAVASGAAGGTGAAGGGGGFSLEATVRRRGDHWVVAQAREAISPAAIAAALRSAAAVEDPREAPPCRPVARLQYTFLVPLAGTHLASGPQQQQLLQQEEDEEAGVYQVLLVLQAPALPGAGGRTSAFIAVGDTAGGTEVRITLDASAPNLAAVRGPPPPAQPPPPQQQPQQLPAAAARHRAQAAAPERSHGRGVGAAGAQSHSAAVSGLVPPPPAVTAVTPWQHAASGSDSDSRSGRACSSVADADGARGGEAGAAQPMPPERQPGAAAAAAAQAAQQCAAAVCHHWAQRQQQAEHAHDTHDHYWLAGHSKAAVAAGRGPGRTCPPMHLPGLSIITAGGGRHDPLDPQPPQCPALVIASPSYDGRLGGGAAAPYGGGGGPHQRPPPVRQQQGKGPAGAAGAGAGVGPPHMVRAGSGVQRGEDGAPSAGASVAAAADAAAAAAGWSGSRGGNLWWYGLACGAAAGVLATAVLAAAVAAISGRGRSSSSLSAAVDEGQEQQHPLGRGAGVAGADQRHGQAYGDEEAWGTQHLLPHQHEQQPPRDPQDHEHYSPGGRHGADGGGSGSPGRVGAPGGLLRRTASGLGSLLSTPLRRARLGAAGRYAPAGSPIAEEGYAYGSGGGDGGATAVAAVAAAGGMLEGSGEANGGGGGGAGTGSLLRWRHHEGGSAGVDGGAMAAGEDGDGAAFLAELEAAAGGGGRGGGGGGGFASTLAQLSPSVLKLLAAGRSATGSWGRDEQGRLRRFSARTTRILNSILASSGGAAAGAPGAAAGVAGADGGEGGAAVADE